MYKKGFLDLAIIYAMNKLYVCVCWVIVYAFHFAVGSMCVGIGMMRCVML